MARRTMSTSGRYLLSVAATLTLAMANTQALVNTDAELGSGHDLKASYLMRDQPFAAGAVDIQIARHEQEDGKAERRSRSKTLSREQRERVEMGRQRFQALPQQDKERIRDARKRYRALPSGERERLRQQWQQRRSERGHPRGDEDRKDRKVGDR